MENRSSEAKETQEISFKLEQYDDIFSDFDMRPYSKRALSVDFLDEIKRAANDKTPDGLELNLHLPEKDRNLSHEATIKDRLAEHFKKHYHLLLKEKHGVLRLGWSMVVLGIIAMVVATFVVFQDPSQNLMLSFLVVFLEPAAWFLLWEGMDQIIFSSKKINTELYFYRKMFNSHRRINFGSY